MKNTLDELQDDQPPPGLTQEIQTAGELCRDSTFVESSISNRDVFNLFEANPGLSNISVVEAEEIVGLINRDLFMRSMARRFHWELYASKRCAKMMSAVPLIVDAAIVTISLGIALATAMDSPDSLLGRADQALYLAKANGRNRVAAPDLPVLRTHTADQQRTYIPE